MRNRKPRRVMLDLHGLSGRAELFRLSGAVERDARVAEWFTDRPIELKAIAQRWFARVRKCGDDVRELLHDGCPVACVGDAAFAYVNTFRSHVNVGFFCGASLKDPAGLLEGNGKRMRHVRITPEREPDAPALDDLIDAAYSDIKVRLERERAANDDRLQHGVPSRGGRISPSEKAKTARKRKGRARVASTRGIDVLREIALQLPDVEDASTQRGVAFKVRGRLLACAAIHASAEPISVVIRIGAEQRARLMAMYPDALYLPAHYAKHPAVLARPARLDRESLRDVLGAAWLFVTEKTVTRESLSPRRKRRLRTRS